MEVGPVRFSTQSSPDVASATPADARQELAVNRDLIQAVKALNAAELFGQNNELTFVLDRETHRPVVRIVDRETGKVIQQIPPEYILQLANDLRLLAPQQE